VGEVELVEQLDVLFGEAAHLAAERVNRDPRLFGGIRDPDRLLPAGFVGLVSCVEFVHLSVSVASLG